MTMNRNDIVCLGLALTYAVTAIYGAMRPAPVEETWRAVVEWPNGESDTLESGSSLQDCMSFLGLVMEEHSVSYCEREEKKHAN